MHENNFKTLGEELSSLYNNFVMSEECIFHYLDFTIPNILREAAKSGKREKNFDTATIMQYRLSNQDFKIDIGLFEGWKPIVEKWAYQNGLKVRFDIQTNSAIDINYTIFSW